MFRLWKILGLLTLAGSAFLNSPPAFSQQRDAQGGGLAATLEVSNPSPGAAEPVTVRFTLTNQSGETLQVLKWHTPLEGFKSNLFRVEHDGKRARYIGALLKRGVPKPADYASLAPGQSLKGDLDLSKGYDLSAPGHYTLQL